MKLMNYTLRYLSVAILGILTVWALIFYINMLDEIYDSIDDGLDNYKLLILDKVQTDSTVLYKTEFAESNYSIHEIATKEALARRDVYQDTLLYMQNEEDFEPVRMLTTAFAHNGRYYSLKVISSMVEEDDLIEDLFYALIWLYVVLLVSILLINNFLLKRIWRPFYQLLDRLHDYQLGKTPAVSASKTNVREFRVLQNAVISLLDRIHTTFTSQKQFIENASHELQTPLAISISRLELLVERNTMAAADQEAVGQVIQTLERLTRLNRSLLLLSKIENKQFTDQTVVSIDDVVRTLAEEFSDFASFREVDLSVVADTPLSFRMNQDLAGIFVSNLLKNAIVHNYAKGTVEIVTTRSALIIRNTGKAVALDAEKMFNRFHKGSSETQSTGLGLAIVKAISDVYGITIAYSYTGKHEMTVRFSS